ncbi:unnamed protein product [Effrenium voratum]|uniref:Uncharacterized protein n=1 Tax=Effrenium voratum TaxID=2562239 RepID=A0AA36IYP5_9DINO|nr:unnamed protein product [Effrenium voratum]
MSWGPRSNEPNAPASANLASAAVPSAAVSSAKPRSVSPLQSRWTSAVSSVSRTARAASAVKSSSLSPRSGTDDPKQLKELAKDLQRQLQRKEADAQRLTDRVQKLLALRDSQLSELQAESRRFQQGLEQEEVEVQRLKGRSSELQEALCAEVKARQVSEQSLRRPCAECADARLQHTELLAELQMLRREKETSEAVKLQLRKMEFNQDRLRDQLVSDMGALIARHQPEPSLQAEPPERSSALKSGRTGLPHIAPACEDPLTKKAVAMMRHEMSRSGQDEWLPGPGALEELACRDPTRRPARTLLPGAGALKKPGALEELACRDPVLEVPGAGALKKLVAGPGALEELDCRDPAPARTLLPGPGALEELACRDPALEVPGAGALEEIVCRGPAPCKNFVAGTRRLRLPGPGALEELDCRDPAPWKNLIAGTRRPARTLLPGPGA